MPHISYATYESYFKNVFSDTPCDLSTREREARGPWVQGLPYLQSKFKADLGYVRIKNYHRHLQIEKHLYETHRIDNIWFITLCHIVIFWQSCKLHTHTHTQIWRVDLEFAQVRNNSKNWEYFSSTQQIMLGSNGADITKLVQKDLDCEVSNPSNCQQWCSQDLLGNNLSIT